MKLLPLGTEEFKKIINNNYYYIDKTKAIEEVVKSSAEVLLFTRPRRFGKTLFMSTLDYFYNIENKDENKKLFKGLYIEKSPYFKNQGTSPVISISLKDINSASYLDMLKAIHLKLRKYFDTIDFFDDLPPNLLSDYNKAKRLETEPFKEIIKILTECYYKHYNKKVVLLIDEYEAPLLNAMQKGYQNEAVEFFKTFYSSALKTNNNLEKGILSGITRISQASIFSGLNNFTVFDYSSKDFADTFGFTQDEVNTALKYYNLEPNKDLIKEYYDGYHFGNLEIYNPWSILNYLASKKLDFYWTQTSNTKIINHLLFNAPASIKEKYIELAKGNKIKLKDINFSNLVLDDLNNPCKVFDFMIATGYLNFNLRTKDAKIVNKEVLKSLPEITSNSLFKDKDFYQEFRSAIRDGELNNLEKLTNDFFLDTYSYHDFPKDANELNYHNILTGMLALIGIGEVKSNREAGSGRYDISLVSYDNMDYSYIIEVKHAKSKQDIQKLLDKGIEQIKENNYIELIKDKEYKGIICFCFYKKEVKIKFELIK